MVARRIVSLVPNATEIVAGLLDDRGRLVGATHECDWPEWVADIPKVVRPADPAILTMAPAEVDASVSASIGAGRSLYVIDDELLASLAPDLIVTQALCDVCAVMPNELQRSLANLPGSPPVVELSPVSLSGTLDDIVVVGRAMNEEARAKAWRERLLARLGEISRQTLLHPLPKVCALEWADPLWIGGHWIPEMIERAGGIDPLGVRDQPSRRADWESVRAAAPDVIIMMCCGYDVERNASQLDLLTRLEGWSDLPAARTGQIWAVDANSYFSRPGPRLVDGIDLLARIIRGRPFAPEMARRLC